MRSIYDPRNYPEGVPNPYAPQVELYPSYVHGTDYTRPTFGTPYVRRPYNVLSGLGASEESRMNYGTSILLMDQDGRRVSGGESSVNPRGGIFGPQGYGGGVFDGSMAGVGGCAGCGSCAGCGVGALSPPQKSSLEGALAAIALGALLGAVVSKPGARGMGMIGGAVTGLLLGGVAASVTGWRLTPEA